MKAFLRKEEGFFIWPHFSIPHLWRGFKMMKIQKIKFGGTSVGSVSSIQTLLNILKDEDKPGNRPVVVLSAMGGVTNLLVSMAEDAAERQRIYRAISRTGKAPL
jgi:aspartokinase/homoserine dehydrogenase 1